MWFKINIYKALPKVQVDAMRWPWSDLETDETFSVKDILRYGATSPIRLWNTACDISDLRNNYGCKNTINEKNPPHQACARDLWIWLPVFRCLTIRLVFNAFSFFLIGTARHVMFSPAFGVSTKAGNKNLHLCNKLLYNLLLMNKVPENVQPFCTLNTKQMEGWK